MIVVADTGFLNYLVRIGFVFVLQPLYSRVLIPQMVADELKSAKAPANVREWIANAPDWIYVRPNPTPDRTLQLLDPGRRQLCL